MNSVRSLIRFGSIAQRLTLTQYTGKRCIARWVSPTMKELVRRQRRNPPKVDPRNSYLEWNRQSELYAFNARLSERFDSDLLLQAFTFHSYIDMELQRQRELGFADPKLDMRDNTELISEGQRLTEKIIKAYLCQALPRAPEECIYAILDHLMSQEVVANASSCIGTKDLILIDEHPVPEEAIACTFFALVTALSQSPNVDAVHVGNFVRDFLIACLSDQELTALWRPNDPERVLNDILTREKRETAEPRLIGNAGVNTLIPVYHVGFYSNKEFLGKGFGETIEEAREAAAVATLASMFGLADFCKPITYNVAIDVTSDVRTENLPLTQWCSENVDKILRQ